MALPAQDETGHTAGRAGGLAVSPPWRVTSLLPALLSSGSFLTLALDSGPCAEQSSQVQAEARQWRGAHRSSGRKEEKAERKKLGWDSKLNKRWTSIQG